MVESDAPLDPQAIILDPFNVVKISEEIVKGKNYIEATVNGTLKGLDIIESASKNNYLSLSDMEKPWIDSLRNDILSISNDEQQLVEDILPTLDQSKILIEEYGL